MNIKREILDSLGNAIAAVISGNKTAFSEEYSYALVIFPTEVDMESDEFTCDYVSNFEDRSVVAEILRRVAFQLDNNPVELNG